MAFTDVFSGDVVQPTDVSYSTLSLTADRTLTWPVPRILDCSDTDGIHTITFPDATLASPGQDVLINNLGAGVVTLYASDGTTVIGTPAAGAASYVYMTGNATAVGTWKYIDFGSAASSSTAASLQGYGVTAIATTLNQDHQFTDVSATTYTTVAADRARFLKFTGSSGSIWTLDESVADAGFFFLVRNAGSADVTLTPSAGDIDGAATKVISAGNAAEIHFDGTDWFSVGYGQSTAFAFSAASLPVGTSTGTVTAASLGWNGASNFITLTGTLSGNLVVTLPATANLYVVYDNVTHGAYTLGLKTPAGAVTYSMTETERMAFFTDGGELLNAVDPSPWAVTVALTAAIAANSVTDQAFALAMAVALG